MKFHSYTLPKIETSFHDSITIGDIKSVKAFAKENKCNLESYLIDCLEATEKELYIMYEQIFSVEATYFNSTDKPILYVKAEAMERGTCKDLFVHVICSDGDSESIYHKYEKVF